MKRAVRLLAALGIAACSGGGGDSAGRAHAADPGRVSTDAVEPAASRPVAEPVPALPEARVHLSEGKLSPVLEPYVRKMMAAHRVPGLVIGVVDRGEVAYQGAFGVRNVHTRQPVTADTVFHLASVAKTVVGTALMQLQDDGKLDLDRPVVDVVPYFTLVDERYPKLTPRMFAGHISGMPDFDSNPWHDPAFDEGALERFVRDFISHKFLTADPVTTYQYCNTGFELLGDVIAKAAGVSFEEYVRARILQPAGMANSTLLLREVDKTRLASPHIEAGEREPGPGGLRVGDVFPYNRMHGPSSTLLATLADMTRYVRIFVGRGEIEGERILSEEAFEEMIAPALGFDRVGVTWHREQRSGQLMLRHGGSDEGFKSWVAFIPDRQLGIVLMGNSETLPAGQVANELLDLLEKSEP